MGMSDYLVLIHMKRLQMIANPGLLVTLLSNFVNEIYHFSWWG